MAQDRDEVGGNLPAAVSCIFTSFPLGVPRSPSTSGNTKGSKRHFSSGEYFFTRLLLIHTGSRSLSTIFHLRLLDCSIPSYDLAILTPPSARRCLSRSGRACTLFPSSLDAILISNSEKITLPSEPFKGLLGEIAPATCQPA